MEQINLNIIPDGVMPVCHASQFDKNRTIRFNLNQNGSVYTLAGTETITCKVRKPDDTESTINVANTSSSYVDVTFGFSDTDLSGYAMCELKIVNGAQTIGSRNFLLNVEADAYDGSVFEERSASGEIASFETNFIDNLTECIVDINAVQAGSGTPSPDNVRPISGHSTCTIKVNDDIDDPQTEITTAIALGTTVYGGSLNVTTGLLTVTHGYVDFGSLTWTLYSGNRWVSNLVTGIKPNASNYRLSGYLCDSFSEATADQLATDTTLIGFSINTVGNIAVRNGDALNTPTGAVVYELATPTTAQLTPTEVRTLLNNNIFADTGNIEVKYLIEVV